MSIVAFDFSAEKGRIANQMIDYPTLDLLMFLVVIVATAPWSGWDDHSDQ